MHSFTFPSLRFSFTVVTLGAAKGDNLQSTSGALVVQAIKNTKFPSWTNLFVNLMAMVRLNPKP